MPQNVDSSAFDFKRRNIMTIIRFDALNLACCPKADWDDGIYCFSHQARKERFDHCAVGCSGGRTHLSHLFQRTHVDSRRLTSTHVDSRHMSHMSQMSHISQMSQSHIIRTWHRNIAAWASVVCCWKRWSQRPSAFPRFTASACPPCRGPSNSTRGGHMFLLGSYIYILNYIYIIK